MGSMLAARRAGITLASKVINSTNAAARMKASGSCGFTVNSSLAMSRAEKNAAAANQAQQQRQHSSGGGLPIFFWLMIFGFVALSRLRRG